MLKELKRFIESIEEELGNSIRITFFVQDSRLCMRVSQPYKDTIVNCEIYIKEELDDAYDEELVLAYFKKVIVKRLLSEKVKYDQESNEIERWKNAFINMRNWAEKSGLDVMTYNQAPDSDGKKPPTGKV